MGAGRMLATLRELRERLAAEESEKEAWTQCGRGGLGDGLDMGTGTEGCLALSGWSIWPTGGSAFS